MIEDQEPVSDMGHVTEIPFELPKNEDAQEIKKVADIVKPNGTNILLRRDQAEQTQGGIILPQKMKSLEFITATVLAKGPDCKFVKEGDRVLVASKALINGEVGIMVEGVRLYFTQEPLIVAVLG